MLKKRIQIGRGALPADFVLRNAKALDVFSGTWLEGDIAIADGYIAGVGERYKGHREFDCGGRAVVPGFIDSHIHIESTMMLPHEFARAVLPRGTTAAIWDPHEIANVMGVEGLQWALACAEASPLDLFVMLSSCVPSSAFETSGAKISASELAELKSHARALGLAEVMDFPSVINGNPEVLAKISAFRGLPIDGHSPMLRGKDLNAYISAGIRSCHEICSIDEAREKLSRGMRVLIREGSVAKNAADLVEILNEYSGTHCMLCTDDRNPLDIHEEGHLDFLLRIAMQKGKSPEIAYRSASLSTALHYGLQDRGALAPGYIADMVVLDDLQEVAIHRVFKSGREVNGGAWVWPESPKVPRENSIHVKEVFPESIAVHAGGKFVSVHAIEVIPNQILTGRAVKTLEVINGVVHSDRETQKMLVIERHRGSGNIGIGYVTGFALREGAIASTVAHDAHNIGIIGASDEAILAALAAIQKMGGGIVAVNGMGQVTASLALPVAGLMSREKFEDLIPKIEQLRRAVAALGCPLKEPFLQMSFLALPVIPALKISDLGLIDVDAQQILPIFA